MFRELSSVETLRVANLVPPRSQVFVLNRHERSLTSLVNKLKRYCDVHHSGAFGTGQAQRRIEIMCETAEWLGFAPLTKNIVIDGAVIVIVVAAVELPAAEQALDAVVSVVRSVLGRIAA